jgi:hypothetical protein
VPSLNIPTPIITAMSPVANDPWAISNDDKLAYTSIFKGVDLDNDGYLTGQVKLSLECLLENN